MNIITKLNIRQRVMLILTILAAAFLAWQIYNFVHGNAAAPSRPLAAGPIPIQAGKAPPGSPPLMPVVQPLPVGVANPELSANQQEYLNLVREYQITKMKRQILEEEASLANAQKRIADAGKGATLSGMDNTFIGDSGVPNTGYQLAYLDRQAGAWTATLSQAGQYTEVHIGTRLADGSRVISISDRGVVLRPIGGKNITLAFQGSVNVDSSSPAYPVVSRPSVNKKDVKITVNNNPSNARIAKILGITGSIAPPKDIPAAPLTVKPPAQPQPAAAPTANVNSAQPQTDNNSAPDTQTQTPVVKPVSVKELREYKPEQPAVNIPPPVALNASD